MKSIHHEDDPKLTAFALGELNGEEAAAVEALMSEDADLRAAVDEIRQTAAMLQAELAAEPALRLSDLQRQRVSAQPKREPALIGRGPLVLHARRFWMGTGLAAAAMIALAVIAPMMQPQGGGRNQVAREMSSTQATDATLGLPASQLRARAEFTDEQKLGQPGAALSEARSAGQLQKSQSPENEVARVQVAAVVPNHYNPAETAASRDRGVQLDFDSAHVPAMPSSEGPAAPGRPTSIAGLLEYPEGWPALRGAAPGRRSGATKDEYVYGFSSGRKRLAGDYDVAKPDADGQTNVDDLLVLIQNWGPVGDPDFRFGWKAGVSQHLWPGTENYAHFADNAFLLPTEAPLSTFSIDVDTASYANIRRFIMQQNLLPPPDAVRIEEMLNYFSYDYEPPTGDKPFSAAIEVNAAPWEPQHRLVRIGIKGKEIPKDNRPPTSLVFLIDVSGSMSPANKLPLIKEGLKLLINELHGDDRLAIVTYAGQAGLLMDSVYVNEQNKPQILSAIESLSAGGSTNGAGGLVQAYEVASKHFLKDGVNRVILCTDGDFNVGVSSEGDLVRLIEQKRDTGVMLSVLGFGMGNLQDSKMKALSKHGNGNYAYIDGLDEARKVLVEQMGGTLITIARDVKFQVEFNPAKVASYRLIGYENRILAAQDFNDDRKDAGEIGAGHTVTALYEVVPVGARTAAAPAPPVDELKYQRKAEAPTAPAATPQAGIEIVPSDELLTLKIRYKEPQGDKASKLLEFPVKDADGAGPALEKASTDFHFAAAVASFGMLLRDSPHKGRSSLENVLDLAGAGVGDDKHGRRAEFVSIVEKVRAMTQHLQQERR